MNTESYGKIKCNMDFGSYPFDTQRCKFIITPDKNITYQVKIFVLFKKLRDYYCLVPFQEFNTTVQLADGAHNEKFDIVLDEFRNNLHHDVDTNETFSKIGFTLILERSPTRFFMNIYIPTALLTIASFISYLIPADMVPGRMALLVTIFLMLVNLSTTEQNRGPVVRLLQF